MKKTFTINLSGLIFHIDEDAYELLQAYLEKLKEHFAGIEGQEEIVTDIETRMAELLQERLGSEKQVVSAVDARYVIDQLGQPFEMDDESNTTETADQTYRRTSRRLFRDPDHSKIAGVAAGLAAYAGIDVVWVRLIFILSLFASGAGLLIYIVLWIVLPEALTHAEKLEMRGDPVNISNIEKSVRKEMNEVSDRLGKAAKHASDTISRHTPVSRNFFNRLFVAFGQVFMALFKVFGVVLGIGLIFGGLSMITALIAGFIGYESVGWLIESEEFRLSPLLIGDLIFGSESVASLAGLSISLILFIPLILLVYGGLKLVSAGRFSIGNFTLVSFTTWIVSWFVLLGLGVSTAMNFRQEAREENTIAETWLPEGQTLFITSDQLLTPALSQEAMMIDDEIILLVDKNTDRLLTFPQLRFVPSSDSLVRIRQRISARGRTIEEAETRKFNMTYDARIEQNNLILPMLYSFPVEDLIRAQELRLTIEIPKGKQVRFDKMLYNEDLPEHRNYRYFKRYAGKTWLMKEQGLTELR